MFWLVLGVLLWAFSHLMKRVTPGLRAGLGDNAGKGLVAVLALVALGLMIWGFRQAPFVPLWQPPDFLRHINNLLVLLAVILVFMQANRGRLRSLMRHPMLTGVQTWAVAHLLVNGDLASVILFGGVLVWAVVDMMAINRMQPVWQRPAPGPVVNDVIYLVATVAGFAVIAAVHAWLGYPVFG